LLYLDPRQLEPDEANVRREAGDLEGLAASLRRYGVLQPLGVVLVNGDGRGSPPGGSEGRYRVVYGNRRREAAIMAGLPTVPCVPVSLGAHPDQLVAQLLENMQRRDLNDMEKAEGLARLRRQLAAEMGSGTGTEALDGRVAELVGLSARTVRRYLALRDLPPAVRDLLAEERLTVTQAQHLSQLSSPALQEGVAARAVQEEWTAAQLSRVCATLARAPGMTIEAAAQVAAGGWDSVAQLGPAPRDDAPPQASPQKLPRVPKEAPPENDDAELWQEDATGAPPPEASGEPDVFAAPGAGGPAPAGRPAPETADGHRVFRIRTLSAFCDEVDRLARCIQDGDLQQAIRGDESAPTRLRLAAKQLGFTLRAVEALLGH
jgi:ParB family chromosome partitioning protein